MEIDAIFSKQAGLHCIDLFAKGKLVHLDGFNLMQINLVHLASGESMNLPIGKRMKHEDNKRLILDLHGLPRGRYSAQLVMENRFVAKFEVCNFTFTN